MNRRGFLGTLTAATIGPWVITKAGVLMPVRKLATVPESFTFAHRNTVVETRRNLDFRVPQDGYYLLLATARAASGLEFRKNGVVFARTSGDTLQSYVYLKDTDRFNGNHDGVTLFTACERIA